MSDSRIRTHFRVHRKFYIGLGIGLGVAGITILIMKASRTKLAAGMDWPEKAPTGTFIFGNNNRNNTVTTIHTGTKGNPGFVTRCIETNELFANQGDASRAFGIPESIMSKHLNFGRSLNEGIHFERVGIFS